MRKTTSKKRVDPAFQKIRKNLPHNYMALLVELLPDLKESRIVYAMEKRCKDLSLKERVLSAMQEVAQDTQIRVQRIGKIVESV